MRRKIFFFLERLEITRSERIAISVLLIVLVIMSGISAFFNPEPNVDTAHYAELEWIFEERSRILHQEEEAILARYEPQEQIPATQQFFAEAIQDTVKPDSAKNEKEQEVETEAEKEGGGVPALININRATAEELQALPGIGPAYSERIVAWREENGPFTSKEQLMEVRGIGEKRLEQIRPLVEL